jgi:hypothetical protein
MINNSYHHHNWLASYIAPLKPFVVQAVIVTLLSEKELLKPWCVNALISKRFAPPPAGHGAS